MQKKHRFAAVAAISVAFGALAACGGGGGGGSQAQGNSPPPPPIAPAAPVVQKEMRAKWMILSWAEIPTVTRYRIMRDADGMSGFSQWGTDLLPGQTIRHIDLPVHLVD